MPETATSRRKDSHLELCATGEVAPRENRTLFGDVSLVHCAMPELALSDVSLATPFFGKTLAAPLLITGMTGGSERAGQVNRELARIAEAYGIAFGVGSQRAMAEDPALRSTYAVREVAKNVVLIGNVGLFQAKALGVDRVRKLADDIQADGLALHLNPAQELTQPEGDRDFTGGYALVEALAGAFGDRLLVKETGCGLSPQVARRLVDCGVKTLDVSGLGGTSWVRVEALRSTGPARELGELMSGWGIPTAAAVASVRRAVGPGVTIIASGGMRTGLDVAKALALGADCAGLALPVFRALTERGPEGATRVLDGVLQCLRQVLLLTGSRNATDLQKGPRVVSGELKTWLDALSARAENSNG